MELVPSTLGQRILDAARIAVAVHLEQAELQPRGQRVAIGRAGPQVELDVLDEGFTDLSTDGRLPARGGREGGVELTDRSSADASSRPPTYRNRFAEGSD
jgi:hypothetical protein